MNKENGSRRSFLQSILAGSAVAAVAVAGGGKTAAAAGRKNKTDDSALKDEILYRETADFRRYYETLKS
ncbi:MAG TPA: hypothetical protein ENK84_13805 [Desulfobulbus sp.]|nr:hypothetical protein [Desulfobulbus sp.]